MITWSGNKYSIRELSGSMGDFGTLIPLAAGYIVVCGLDPSALLVTVGLVSIITGTVFKLPIPVEPMKVLAAMAIAQGWTPSLVYASGFAMGITWVVFSITGVVELIARYTPQPVIRGIQVALGVMLAVQAFGFISTWWLLGIAGTVLALLLKNNRYLPSMLIIMVLGTAISLYRGLPSGESLVGFSLPVIQTFDFRDLWPAMLLGGFAQIPLTATNSVLSTSSLLKTYWPETEIRPNNMSLSVGLFNMGLPFLGGMPICHGAGGLAAKHFFGARTGGANISIGIIEIIAGLFLAGLAALVFANFPEAIIGSMMLLIGFELIKFARSVPWGWDYLPLSATVVVAVLANMAYGFLAGMAVYYIIRRINPGQPGCHKKTSS